METGNTVGWFELPAGRSLAGLVRTLGRAGYLAGPPAVSRYESVFMETQDGRLARRGVRLSIRKAGPRITWHLMGPDGQSEELFDGNLSFRSLSPDTPGLPAAVREAAGGRLLLPLVRLRVFAWQTRLQGPSASTLALGAERFTAAPPRGEWTKGPWRHGIVSVRLLEGDPDAFLHLATYLRDRLGFSKGAGDACQAALLTLGIAVPGAPAPTSLLVRPADPLALAARKVVGQQVLKIRANVAGTLEDLDPEYLHDLRVATRRLRSALRLFGGVLGVKRCDALRVGLGWVGQSLGAVRDLDVFIQNLQDQAQRLGESGVIAGILAEELARQRGPARETLTATLGSHRFLSLMRRLEALAASPPPRRPRGIQGAPVAAAAPALIRKAQKRVLRLGRLIGPGSPAADLHRLRILCKRLRYTCEFFREAFAEPDTGTDPLADYIGGMVRFQDCLGEHQDAAVAMVRIQDLAGEMVRRGALAPERLLDLGGLIQVQREIARERRGRLAKLWSRFDRRSVRRRLKILEAGAGQAEGESESGETAPEKGGSQAPAS